jgi:DMSO/TMAO reductase YedYZ molybdopterin-dependent catalytic subunit
MIEKPEIPEAASAKALARQSRRDFLAFGAGILATLAGAWWLMPDRTKARLLPAGKNDPLDTVAARTGRDRLLNQALTFDDDVAEALYSKTRKVRTFARSEVTPLKPNYHGLAPLPQALDGWALTVDGLASGRTEKLVPATLARFPKREQVTRLVCVEGWSAVAWWGGFAFADLLEAFPPRAGARWAALRSDVSRDARGNPEPYFVSLDLATAQHPQTLLATELSGRPLPLAHGAPLRLVTPVKLGLKNIKAITHITYQALEPPDFWHQRGYSKYDGL